MARIKQNHTQQTGRRDGQPCCRQKKKAVVCCRTLNNKEEHTHIHTHTHQQGVIFIEKKTVETHNTQHTHKGPGAIESQQHKE